MGVPAAQLAQVRFLAAAVGAEAHRAGVLRADRAHDVELPAAAIPPAVPSTVPAHAANPSRRLLGTEYPIRGESDVFLGTGRQGCWKIEADSVACDKVRAAVGHTACR